MKIIIIINKKGKMRKKEIMGRNKEKGGLIFITKDGEP